jgi:hypothetical protein
MTLAESEVLYLKFEPVSGRIYGSSLVEEWLNADQGTRYLPRQTLKRLAGYVKDSVDTILAKRFDSPGMEFYWRDRIVMEPHIGDRMDVLASE